MNIPLVSVLIPTRARAAQLTTCLDSLFITSGFSHSEHVFEVLIMGDEDDEESIRYFEALRLQFNNIRTFVSERKGYNYVDGHYYRKMEEHAFGEFVWFAGDDMVVQGDWVTELQKVQPRCIVQPEISMLNASTYLYAEGQAFPIVPRFAWKECCRELPCPVDIGLHLNLTAKGWRTWFLKGVTMIHNRALESELQEHRK
jgi:glycosyltransferase involved in cell wall biosynthesis